MVLAVILILSVLGSILAQSGSPPDSPCPAVFRYSYSPSQGWHGVVSIVPPLTFSEVQLVLSLKVALYRPDSGVGKIDILGGATEVQNIANRASTSQRQTIQYLVVFPPYEEFPRISSVIINGNEFCPSPADYDNARGVIQLKYTLKTGLAVATSNGNEFSVSGAINTQPQQPTQQQWQTQQPTQQQWQQQQPQQPSRPATPPPTAAPRPRPTSRPPVRPPARPTTKPTVSTTLDEYDQLYHEEEEDDFTIEYQVNLADCGRTAVTAVNTLIVRGEDTAKGEWPWMAAIYQNSDNSFRCAGSLISRRHVVTAAHCVTEPVSKRQVAASSLLIRLGRYNLDSNEPDEQIMAIDQILVNPKYMKSKKQDYDIGLIVMKTAAVITDFVRTVCLWDDTLDIRVESLTSKIGLAPGWGKDERGIMTKTLKLARMPVRSQSVCVESDPEFYSAIISDKTFCAGYTNGTSLCNGDSGGGLYFYQENPKTRQKAWFVRGIVSLSKRNELLMCGETNYVVFTDISAVLRWILPRLAPPQPSR